ncbi:MAG TPA: hypothetical protein DEG44_04335 [Candidatus Kerfeldbacteria bacterium]|nr:hypothetical protein [Candidatus Kerfeldbacteria bacterium]
MVKIVPQFYALTKHIKIQYNSSVIRRWNLTIILIITAFVLGVVAGYVYRDRFSWFLPNKAELERTEPDIEAEIFQAEIEDILRPDTGIDAASGVSEVFAFTGSVQSLTLDGIVVENPDGAIDFILTDTTRFAALSSFIDQYGLPDTAETDITLADIAVGDLVSVYTIEDIRTAEERHVTLVQKLNNE